MRGRVGQDALRFVLIAVVVLPSRLPAPTECRRGPEEPGAYEKTRAQAEQTGRGQLHERKSHWPHGGSGERSERSERRKREVRKERKERREKKRKG